MTAPLRTVLVGFGGISAGLADDARMKRYFRYATHAQVLRDHPDFECIAVVDPRQDARDAAQSIWKIPITAADVAELPADLAPDVAVIATPPDARLGSIPPHASLRGLLVEKPIGSPGSGDSRRFMDYCLAHDIAVQVNFWRRGDVALQNLATGELHKLIGQCQAGSALYGNGLFNNGIHLIDLVRMLLGNIAEVRALSDLAAETHGPIKGDYRVAFALKLRTGALIAVHPLDFSNYREVGLDLWGTAGRLQIAHEGLNILHYPRKPHRALEAEFEIDCESPSVTNSQAGDALFVLYSNFAAAVRGAASPLSPIGSALDAEAVLDAVAASARDGGRAVALGAT
jgi:predicted dehydrogenase